MKCSGARDTRKGIKPCGRLAKADQFDAFCSAKHRDDALQFVGDEAYNKHVEHFRSVFRSGIGTLKAVFNTGPRVMFVSMQEAQKHKLQDHYINTVCAEYAQGVRNAWSNVGDDAGSSSFMNDLREVQERKQYVGKRKSVDGFAQMLFGSNGFNSQLALEYNPSSRDSSFSSKKSRTGSYVSDLEVLAYEVDEPDEVTSPTAPAPAPLPVDPVNVPLPDAGEDDDLMSE